MTSIGKIYQALAAVQADMARVGVGKAGVNDQQRFRFRKWDDVQQALAATLAAHKVIGPLPNVVAVEHTQLTTPKGAIMHRCVMRGSVRFVSGEDGSHLEYEVCGEAMDMGDKSTSKAMTMMIKYAITHGLCIPIEGVADADSDTPDEQIASPPSPAPSNNVRKENNRYVGLSGPHKTMTALQQAVRAIGHDLAAMTDQMDIAGLINDHIATIDQCKRDLPNWYEPHGDSEGLANAIKNKWFEVGGTMDSLLVTIKKARENVFPGDLPPTAAG